jgi:hypothetical protein
MSVFPTTEDKFEERELTQADLKNNHGGYPQSKAVAGSFKFSVNFH